MVKIGDVVRVSINHHLKLFNVVTFKKPYKVLTAEYVTIKPTKLYVNIVLYNKSLINRTIKATGWVEGIVIDFIKHNAAVTEVNYNPKKYPYFYTSKDEKEYKSLEYNLNFKHETCKAYICP